MPFGSVTLKLKWSLIILNGQTTVMWSAEADGVRTVWLWRRGTPEAIVLSQKARGPVLHDGGQSFVAFLEKDDTGASAVRANAQLATPYSVAGTYYCTIHRG